MGRLWEYLKEMGRKAIKAVKEAWQKLWNYRQLSDREFEVAKRVVAAIPFMAFVAVSFAMSHSLVASVLLVAGLTIFTIVATEWVARGEGKTE